MVWHTFRESMILVLGNCICDSLCALFHGLMSLTVFYTQSVSLFGISEYLDEAMLIPKNTSVLIRRVPGRPRMPIIIGQEYYLKLFNFLTP
jgi:hypothetical protein